MILCFDSCFVTTDDDDGDLQRDIMSLRSFFRKRYQLLACYKLELEVGGMTTEAKTQDWYKATYEETRMQTCTKLNGHVYSVESRQFLTSH